MLTFLPLEQIDEMDKWEGSQLNQAKEILAYELTGLVHGEEEAKKAQEGARALFSKGNAADMPTTEIEEADLTEGEVDLITLLQKSNLASTRSDGRRAIEQGGVSIDGEKSNGHQIYGCKGKTWKATVLLSKEVRRNLQK